MLLWLHFSLYNFIELSYLVFCLLHFLYFNHFFSFNSSQYGQINQAVSISLSFPWVTPFSVFHPPVPVGTGCCWGYCTPSVGISFHIFLVSVILLSPGLVSLFLVLSHSGMFDSAALWTVAYQPPLSMEFSSQEYWSRLPFPTPEDLPDPGIEPAYITSPALTGRFFTPRATLISQVLWDV